ncbi:uncharacterized protein LODBEIA_P41460 [Lodderomyces beijingensis]|uniref:Anaphase-promoting complex subunit CDC26 n=1 Tax=Lodderomyces beijingensis TaxID=1775926 RepID=A0ABP0ZRE8_9ASCO
MLRREATTIKLSPEDVLEYDESLERQKLSRAQGQQQLQQSQQQSQSTFQNQTARNNSDFNSSNILQEQMNSQSDNADIGGNDILPDLNNSTVSERQTRSKSERIGVAPR